MQNAKDTFYTMLQGRLAVINPARTIVVRGVVRPGSLVEENELATDAVETDAYRLRWTGLSVDLSAALPLCAMECVIDYATDGSVSNGGMDRGRALAAMDAELLTALRAWPRTLTKMNYAGAAKVAMATNVFWGDALFGAGVTTNERLARVVTVTVYAYQEAGEL